MLTLLLIACSSSPPPAPPAPPAPTAPAPAAAPAPAPASPHAAPAPKGLGVFQGIVREVHVAEGTQFVRLEGCDTELWVGGELQPVTEGQTLVTLGGTERPAAIPQVSGTPTVRFVSRMAPAREALDCSLEGRTGYAHVGTVLQAHTAAGYTYAELAYCDRVAWIAGPEAAIAKGQLAGHPEGTPQAGFESKSLGRRFDHITFVPALGPVEGDALDCD